VIGPRLTSYLGTSTLGFNDVEVRHR
jgi:hypothetical protein